MPDKTCYHLPSAMLEAGITKSCRTEIPDDGGNVDHSKTTTIVLLGVYEITYRVYSGTVFPGTETSFYGF